MGWTIASVKERTNRLAGPKTSKASRTVSFQLMVFAAAALSRR